MWNSKVAYYVFKSFLSLISSPLQKQLGQTVLPTKLKTIYLAGLWNSQRKFHLSSGTATRRAWGKCKGYWYKITILHIFNKFVFIRCKIYCMHSSHGLKMMYCHITVYFLVSTSYYLCFLRMNTTIFNWVKSDKRLVTRF